MFSETKVTRPDLPLLLISALCLWVCCAAAYEYSSTLSTDIAFVLIIVGVFVAVLGISIFVVLRYCIKKCYTLCKLLFTIIFAALGLALGCCASIMYYQEKESVEAGETECTIYLTSDLSSNEFGVSASGDVLYPDCSKYNMKIMFDSNSSTDCLYNGAIIECSAIVSKLSDKSAQRYYQSGIVAQVKVSQFKPVSLQAPYKWIYECRKGVISSLEEYGGDSGPLLQALVCGYRPGIVASGEYDLYKQVGLAHVVAVSGAHLAIVAAAFGALLKLIRCSRRVTFALTSIFVLAYLLFAGIPISAVRASVMVILSMCAGMFGRRGASLNALAICIIAFIAIDPVTSVSVSFFLSAGSTLGIILFSPLISSWFGKPEVRTEKSEAIGKGIKEPLALTLSSNIVTLPFSVAMFSMLPIISPVSNIIATPLFTIACIAGLIASVLSCISAPLVAITIPIAGLLAAPMRISVDVLSKIPYANISVEGEIIQSLLLSGLLMALLWAIWPKSGKRVALCSCLVLSVLVALFALRYFSPHGDEIVMLNVGQGDSFLVRSNNSAVLIDTGNQDAMLQKAMLEQGISKLDALIVTHHDDDHMGSMTALTSYVQVDKLIVASDLLACDCKNCIIVRSASVGKFPGGIVGVDVGNFLSVGKFSLKVIWPHEYEDEGGNADSICLLVNYDADGDGAAEWKSLFTGDAEKEQLKSLIDSKSVGDIDVLKVGHHGSKVSIDNDVLHVLQPEIALISAGEGNRYGHPTQTALSELEKANSKIYRTDEDGTVMLSFTKDEIKVQ